MGATSYILLAASVIFGLLTFRASLIHKHYVRARIYILQESKVNNTMVLHMKYLHNFNFHGTVFNLQIWTYKQTFKGLEE